MSSFRKNGTDLERIWNMFSALKKTRLLFLAGLSFLCLFAMTESTFAEGGSAIEMDLTDKNLGECNSTLGEKLASYGSPYWYEKPYSIINSAVKSVCGGIYSATANGSIKFLGVLVALWLAVQTMKLVGSMTETNLLEFLTRVGGRCIRVGCICALLMGGGAGLQKYIWDPIVESVPGEMGGGVSDTGVLGGASAKLAQVKAQGMTAMTCLLMIWKINAFDFVEFHAPDPTIFAFGCIGFFFAWVVGALFPIVLFDYVIKKGFVFAFAPLFLAAFAFEPSRGFGEKGINAALNIIFFSVCLSILLDITVNILGSITGLKGITDGNLHEGSYQNAVCPLRILGSSADDDECNGIHPETIGLFTMGAMGFYCLFLVFQAEKFATYFSGASLDFGKPLALKAATGAASAAQGTASTVWKGGKMAYKGTKATVAGAKAVGRGAQSIGRGVKGLWGKAKNAFSKKGPSSSFTPVSESGEFRNKSRGNQMQKDARSSSNAFRDAERQMRTQINQNIKDGKYANTPAGREQRTYDEMRADQMKMQADYADRVATDPAFSKSAEAKTARDDINASEAMLKEAKNRLDGIKIDSSGMDKIEQNVMNRHFGGND